MCSETWGKEHPTVPPGKLRKRAIEVITEIRFEETVEIFQVHKRLKSERQKG